MVKRLGSYLEEGVAVLFEKAGFKVKLNSKINSYEIDVLASKGSYKIAIECKQYENSHLTIRNILHQWASKKNSINVDKIVVAIAGQQPREEDYKLATQLDITLIDDSIIHSLNSIMDKKKLKEGLNDLICFDKKLYEKKQKNRLMKIFLGMGIYLLILAFIYFFFGIGILAGICILISIVLAFFSRKRIRSRSHKSFWG